MTPKPFLLPLLLALALALAYFARRPTKPTMPSSSLLASIPHAFVPALKQPATHTYDPPLPIFPSPSLQPPAHTEEGKELTTPLPSVLLVFFVRSFAACCSCTAWATKATPGPISSQCTSNLCFPHSQSSARTHLSGNLV